MGVNTVLGTILRSFFKGGLAPLAVEMWWACAPVVALMAPVGSYVNTRINLGAVRVLLYAVLTMQFYFVVTIVTVKQTFYMFVGVSVLVVWMSVCIVVGVGGSIRDFNDDD